jgi:pSer/pThr/pTyr-binding forkhead associated (FHA) protein
MRFRLRYLHHDLELSEGEFALGRSAECQLSLDDPLVSRRHALLVVAKDRVTIEDLQSRNGIAVNGQRVVGQVALKAGDRILIGSQELTLHISRETGERDRLGTTQAGRLTLPKIAAAVHVSSEHPTRPASEPPVTEPGSSDPGGDVGTERRAEAFALLGGVADKALALGRAEEAERLLATALLDVVEASRIGKQPSPTLVDVAARFAAKLATATAKGAWADYVIELYEAQGRPCPAPVIDELYSALRKVNAIDLPRLRGYVAHLRERQATLGPAEKFLLLRIEGLERLAALR